ncbi:WcaF family extracellular polysaccharide biosynthesis acetyltransferase [Pontibacter harenae]|uniref:WcaF family extracellular polysaccharide biosynthesis acetyltransferase n=1 Tax=Pontibacter harenae TaxID=2894083 RepID=UPI001E39D458|nr:WcaF family extracellular polysaccharide biosynthesis acetyltransferase [Pontibacter harenae]MCC9168221.1 WcaF family extracellular polysaccharide biosynthesis acetyltransferase [Pontibacter harenae]
MQNKGRVDLSAYDNSWFNTGAGALKRAIWFFVNALFFVNPFNPISSVKVLLLRAFGAKVGAGVVIKPGVNVKYPWLLTIGNYVWIGENVWIDNLTSIVIQDNVVLSQGAMLLTGSHNYKKATFDLQIGEIMLQEGCWIGAQATVCPGVTCGSHSVLSVGSVATKDLEAYTIYQGNPAIPKRTREIL